ncbi:MAG: 30S ribosomal protein S20 [Armatimonadota bacterium]
MPNIKSVIKDVKKSRERHARNIAVKSKIKTMVKKAKVDVTLVPAATSTIDKAAEKGIIHKNAAARRKSRLMRAVNKASA